jgi:tRNA-binding EMAP/Myf-like protein
MEKIAFEEYSKVVIKVGKITEAERVPNSKKNDQNGSLFWWC